MNSGLWIGQLKPRYDNLSRKFSILIAIPTALFSIFLSNYLDETRSWEVGFAIFIMSAVALIYWHLRKEIWFWFSIAALGCLHAAIISYFPWSAPAHYPAFELLAPGFLDFFISSLWVKAVGRVYYELSGRSVG